MTTYMELKEAAAKGDRRVKAAREEYLDALQTVIVEASAALAEFKAGEVPEKDAFKRPLKYMRDQLHQADRAADNWIANAKLAADAAEERDSSTFRGQLEKDIRDALLGYGHPDIEGSPDTDEIFASLVEDRIVDESNEDHHYLLGQVLQNWY